MNKLVLDPKEKKLLSKYARLEAIWSIVLGACLIIMACIWMELDKNPICFILMPIVGLPCAYKINYYSRMRGKIKS